MWGRRLGRAGCAALVALVAVGAVGNVAPPAADAAIVAPFALVYNQELYGDFVVAGNAVTTCPAATPACLSAGARTGTTNNDSYAMAYTDADATVSTLNSSTAEVTVPPGATVRHARLTWAGNTGVRGGSAGSRCTTAAATSTPPGSPATQTVRLRVAGGTVVDLPPAAYSFTGEAAPASGIVQYYSADADVTAAFASAPTGEPFDVTVGNIWTPSGQNCFGGWSVYVVWAYPNAESTYAPVKREVFIYDGHIRQAQDDPDTTTSITGFRVAGGGANRVGLTSYEGDYGITGDQLEINGNLIADPYGGSTVTDNFFVSDGRGASDPALANNFSVDAKSFTIPPSIIGPGETSADLTFSTDGDSYLAQEVALSVPIPNVQVTKTAAVSTARPGDVVEFTIGVKNPTDIPAVDVVATDALVPACDRAIGDLPAQGSTSYTCEGVMPDVDTFVNGVHVTATNQFGDALADDAETEPIDVYDGSITLTKTTTTPDVAPGGTVAWTITVTNTADVALTDVAVVDPQAPDCARDVGDLAVGSAPVSYSCTATAGALGFSNTATVTATDAYGRASSDQATDAFTVTAPPAGSADREEGPQGSPVAFTPSEGDTPSTGADFVPGDVVLVDPDTGDEVTTLVVDGEGTWAVEGDGTVTFTPLPGFHGDTTPVTYRLPDDAGLVATATLTATVTPVTPSIVADEATTGFDDPVTVAVLANDEPGLASVPLDPATVTLLDPGTDEGTWTVTDDGEVTFAPDAGFTGPTTPVTYRVADENGTTGTASVVVVVGAGPEADPDTATVRQGGTVAVDVLDGDEPGDGASIAAGSVQLFDAVAGTWGDAVTVAGEGTYTVGADDRVTFAAAPAFVGIGSVVYRFTDSGSDVGSSTLAVTVTAVNPVAADDEATTPFDHAVVVDVLDDDEPGHPSVPLEPATLVLVDPATGDPTTTLVVPGEGTWAVGSGGTVAYTPVPGFAGEAGPVAYRVADANGTVAEATVAVTVGAAPVARADSESTPQNVDLSIGPTTNDSPGTGATIDTGSVQLLDPGTSTWGLSLTVPGEGSYVVDGGGAILFSPVADLVGPTTPITYRFADSHGNRASSTITVMVTGITPTARDDEAWTPHATPVSVPVLDNDGPGAPSAPLVQGSVQLVDPDSGALGLDLTVAGEGTWTVLASGIVRFAPDVGFEGPATPVTYQVRDANSTATRAAVAVTVGAAPVAGPDSATTPQDVAVDLDVLADDAPGTGAILDPASVELRDDEAGTWVTSLTVAGEGAWSVAGDGAVTFDPVPTLTGEATPVTYRVVDSDGNAATATIAVTVTPITPTATDDEATTPYGAPVTLAVLDNDEAGAASAPLVPASVRLVDPATGDPVATLGVDGEGTWTTDAGAVTFTPDDGFEGPATPVAYVVADDNGTTATAEIDVTVGAAPVARPDLRTTLQDTTVTLAPAADDSPGTGATLVLGSLDLFDPADSTWVDTLTVAGEGAWSLDGDGTATFDPFPAFTGTSTPVRYRIADSDGNRAASTVTVEVAPVTPTVVADAATTPFATPVAIDVLANDVEGASNAPLVAGSVGLVGDDGDLVPLLIVSGEGRWDVEADGSVTFTPASGFSGVTAPVTYEVSDDNGTPGRAPIVVTVGHGPAAEPDTASTPQNVAVALDPLANDEPGEGATLDETSLEVFDAAAGTWGSAVTVAGEGSFAVAPDGTVTFTPLAAFTGTASVPYRVADSDGNGAASTLAVTVVPVVPRAVDDAATTPSATPVLLDVLANDSAGAVAAGLDPATLVLLDPGTGEPVTELTVDGQGTWTVADGRVGFTPDVGFAGATAPVTYRVADTNGTTTTAVAVVTVGAGPSAEPDAVVGAPGQPVTLDVLGNDLPSDGGSWDPATLCIVTPGGGCGPELVIEGEGTWTVGPEGTLTFTPEPGFAGRSSVDYEVGDTLGNVTTTTATATIPAAGEEPPAIGEDVAEPPAPVPDEGWVYDLARTGAEVGKVVLVGLALLGGGAAVVALARRRRAPAA